MRRRRGVLIGIVGALVVLAAAGVGWLMSLPATPLGHRNPQGAQASPIASDEHAATLAALKPPKRQRPLIAILGINEGTEVTDYLMPYGILRSARMWRT